MTVRDSRDVPRLAFGLTTFVLIEWLLLRLGTRTLIHIPGLGRFETPIDIIAETGRFAYYAAVVFLIALLGLMAARGVTRGDNRAKLSSVAVSAFLAGALVGRLGWISANVVGWVGLLALLTLAALAWRGRRTLPVAFFAASTLAATFSQLGQGSGGGLSVSQVDGLLLGAEMLLILSGLSSPLLLGRLPSPRSLVIGLGAAGIIGVALARASSTVSILILWSLGVPGWLPGITFAIAFGALVTTVVSAVGRRDLGIAIGLVLLMTGGVGAISTYQTGLVLAGLLLVAGATSRGTIPAAMTASDGDLREPYLVAS